MARNPAVQAAEDLLSLAATKPGHDRADVCATMAQAYATLALVRVQEQLLREVSQIRAYR